MKSLNKVIVFFVFILGSVAISAQDFSNVKVNKPVTISGGANFNGNMYDVQGAQARSEPFIWLFNANLNMNVYGLNIPFTATFSQMDQSYTQPFNRYGLSPKYKNLTVHLGWRSMQFSSYTLAGLSFLGGGFEYKPEKIPVSIAALYGRFAKGVAYQETPSYQLSQPAYERWGWGAKVTLGNDKNNIDLIVFRAMDDSASVDSFPKELGIKPEENFVLGLNTKQKLTERISFAGEYALSAYTSDIRAGEYVFDKYTYANNLGDLYTPRMSSSFNSAIVMNIAYTFDKYSFGVGFRQVDPEYRSLGAGFLNNDTREYTINASTALFKKKLMIAGNLGTQENNLDGNQMNTMTRVIAAVNCSYAFAKSLNMTAAYGNFNATSQPSIMNVVDTIKILQITKNSSLGLNYSFGHKNLQHAITMNGN